MKLKEIDKSRKTHETTIMVLLILSLVVKCLFSQIISVGSAASSKSSV